MKSAVTVCSPTKDHWMNLTGFPLDTKMILELLWCLAVFSGKLSGIYGSEFLLVFELSYLLSSEVALCGFVLQRQDLPTQISWQLKLGLFPEWNWKY